MGLVCFALTSYIRNNSLYHTFSSGSEYRTWYNLRMNHHRNMKGKFFEIAYPFAIGVVSLILAVGVYTKLRLHPSAVALFNTMGLSAFIGAFGLIQFIILVCLLFKPTRIIGTLVGSAYYGAGVAMMLASGQSATAAGITLVLIWFIHKCTWWSMWSHGYHCACDECEKGHEVMPRDRNTMCKCDKPHCRCVEGSCDC